MNITFPANLFFDAGGITCQQGGQAQTCSLTYASGSLGTYLASIDFVACTNSALCTASATLSFAVNGLLNSPLVDPVSAGNISLTTKDLNAYTIDQGSVDSLVVAPNSANTM